MAIIEDPSGEWLIIQRLGIEFATSNGQKIHIDSEPVVDTNYNIAVYIDAMESDAGEIDLALKEYIIWRVFTLANSQRVALKFFDDCQNEIIPSERKNPFVD